MSDKNFVEKLNERVEDEEDEDENMDGVEENDDDNDDGGGDDDEDYDDNGGDDDGDGYNYDDDEVDEEDIEEEQSNEASEEGEVGSFATGSKTILDGGEIVGDDGGAIEETDVKVIEKEELINKRSIDTRRFSKEFLSSTGDYQASPPQSAREENFINIDLSGFTDHELTSATKKFKEEMSLVDIESSMLVGHIQRLVHDGYHFKIKSDLKLNVRLPNMLRKMTGFKGAFLTPSMKRLNMRHRIDAVTVELSVLKDIIKVEANKMKNVIKMAASGVIDLTRQMNILKEKKAAFDEIFDSSTALAGAGKPKNTNILKFWQEEIHKMETDVLKLRLKKVALKLNLAKMQSLFNQAAETNETLSENDIHLMKIKNHILNKKIKEGNENLLVLKITAGMMRLKLNSLKTSLVEAEKISSVVDTKIVTANEQAEKSTQEIKHVNKSLAKIKEQNKNILRYINTYSVPEVIEYAKFVENIQPLERQIKHYSRKIDVKLIEIKKAEKSLNERLRNKHIMSVKKCSYY